MRYGPALLVAATAVSFIALSGCAESGRLTQASTYPAQPLARPTLPPATLPVGPFATMTNMSLPRQFGDWALQSDPTIKPDIATATYTQTSGTTLSVSLTTTEGDRHAYARQTKDQLITAHGSCGNLAGTGTNGCFMFLNGGTLSLTGAGAIQDLAKTAEALYAALQR